MIRDGRSPEEVDALLSDGDMLESLTRVFDIAEKIEVAEDLTDRDLLADGGLVIGRDSQGLFQLAEYGVSDVPLYSEDQRPTASAQVLFALGDVALELQSWPEFLVSSAFLAVDVALGGPVKAVMLQLVEQAAGALIGDQLNEALEFAATHVYAYARDVEVEQAKAEIATGGEDASAMFAGSKLLVAALVPAIVPAGQSIKAAVAPRRGNPQAPNWETTTSSTTRSGLLPTELSQAVRTYGDEVQQITGYRLLGTQSNYIKSALQTADYSKPLSASGKAAHRAQFNSAKSRLIREWEANTGQTWPTYECAPSGRTPGAKWDAHELIPNQNGGPIEWWNITPARFPDQHQGGIHGAGSAFNNLMQTIGRQ